ncbi:MAG: hypothetical protein KAQ68_08000 [Clostridiales bacterium]|nr:hypothetical protein [Clostridiales bacterium]
MTYTNRKRQRFKIKPRFYLFLAIFIAIIVWAIFAISRLFEPLKVEWGRLSTDLPITAIIVRDEQVVFSSEYGKFESIAGEGDSVSQGEEVAIMYHSEFSEEDIDTLISIRQNIKNYQEENVLKNIKHGDLNEIDLQIEGLIDEITELVRINDLRILPVKERELKTIMEDRRTYLNDTLHRDAKLDEDFQREEVMVDKIQRSVISIQSPNTGIISFFLDGIEGALQKESVELINNEDFENIEKQLLTSSIISNINEGSLVTLDQAIYRIIDPNHWYAVIKMPRNKNTLVKGGSCDVTFESYAKTINNAYVFDVRHYDKEVIIVLEINQNIGPMASLRIVTGHLGRSNEGYKVPNSVLVQVDDQRGIFVFKEDNSKVFIPIKIIDQNHFETIISVLDTSNETIYPGQVLVKP